MTVRACLLLLSGLLAGCSLLPEETPLETLIAAVIKDGPGVYSVATENLVTGERVLVNAGERTHAASLMKLPVMMAVFTEVEAGRLSLDRKVEVTNRFVSIVDGSEYEVPFGNGSPLAEQAGGMMTLRRLVEEMIQNSDNVATNLVMGLVSAERVQALVEQVGASNTFVRRGVEDTKAYEAGISNETDALGMLILLTHCRDGSEFSAESRAAMMAILRGQRIPSMIVSGLPKSFVGTVAHKTGSISWVDHDAGIVEPENGVPYAIVILTHSFGEAREEAVLRGQVVAEVVYNHWNRRWP